MLTDLFITISCQLFSWTILTIVLSWLLAVGYPLFARLLNKKNAYTAALLTFIYGLLAPASTLIALILLSLPTLAFPFITQHCHGIDCTPHNLQMPTDTLEGVVSIGGISILFLLGCVQMFKQLLNAQKKLRALSGLSDKSESAFRMVENPEKLAWCTGLLRPQVYLSSGLVKALAPHQVFTVLAHELAHAARRDNLRKWCLHWATILWPGQLKQQIRCDLSRHTEIVCDLTAAMVIGDANGQGVIETLNKYRAYDEGRDDTEFHRLLQQRKAAFEKAPRNREGTVAISVAALSVTVGVWLGSILLAVHFGHPLLEWLTG